MNEWHKHYAEIVSPTAIQLYIASLYMSPTARRPTQHLCCYAIRVLFFDSTVGGGVYVVP